MHIYSVAVLRDLNGSYSYSHDDVLPIGQLVIVDFRNSCIVGIIVGVDDNGHDNFKGKIKRIDSILPYGILKEYVELAQFITEYYFSRLGSVFKSIIPFAVDLILSAEKNGRGHQTCKPQKVELNSEQTDAVMALKKFKDTFRVSLLHGLTGSGKTEVFLEFLKDMLDRQILIMVPEIALSRELAQKVAARLEVDVFIWHNSISKVKKLEIWRKAIHGESMVVIGARSAVFIPFRNLAAIVVDEEHDVSFKQDEGHIYNARDMAIYLGYRLEIPVILSSATPSIESYNNAKGGKYEYVNLPSRYRGAALPEITIDDLRSEKSYRSLSSYSIEKINECLASNKQALVFVNRRGHTPRVLCRSCGWKITCTTCSAWLCYHQSTGEFICHYCGRKIAPVSCCAECGKETLIGAGTGIEKVFHECEELFEGASILVLSSDTIDTPNKISNAIERIKNNEVNIILGTQLVAKGHNFDNLSLVIVACADSMLYGDDFRATERAFQMIQQVSGRAGRVNMERSEVVIQTYNPDDELMQLIKCNDFEKLYDMEICNRQAMDMPPFGKVASIVISSMSEKKATAFANRLVSSAPRIPHTKVLGPIQPAIYRVRSRYRQRIIVVSKNQLHEYLKEWLGNINPPRDIKLTIDVDPYNFT
ncbi:MAG: primosomal protein N' [Holosporales bacterium]|jgi:primosomal protein N' (replication factor Y)|nr:primosomal protein N' [Holosporales bacterium]